MKNIIYGLADNRNDLIYYVGKSSVAEKRPLTHLTNSHSDKVNKWVDEVRNNWGDIKIFILEEVEDLNELSEREKYWISEKLKINKNLLNKKDLPKVINYYSDEDERKFDNLRKSILFCSDIIKKKRLSLNLTQQELAELSSLNRYTISQIENGISVTTDSLSKVILALVGKSIDNEITDLTIKNTSRVRK
jgi:DNA-binding XRE family transcriptional regulator